MCCPCSTKVAADDNDAKSTEMHRKRVIALLLEGGDIGLGEMEDSQVSLAATLRYAVLRVAQSAAFCFASAMSLFAWCLCTSGGNEELPEGATKYVVVEFNAWVYSGVRRRFCVELGM